MNRPSLVLALVCLTSPTVRAADEPARGLPLPAAPVRLVIPDVPAFDAALGGGFRRALTGEMESEDPVLNAWRQTQVGAKLELQWEALSSDLPWTWNDILATRARSIGIALLSAASLEVVVVLDTPLVALPAPLSPGAPATHKGLPFALVTRGAGDGSTGDRRAGFAWARASGRLILATSERAMRLALDEVAASRGMAPPLPGLASLDLDIDALSKDLYFSREFLFSTAGLKGHVRAALRLEAGRMVEVREGDSNENARAFAFDATSSAASGWEADTSRLWPSLREGLLETVPEPAERPVPPRSQLPSPGVTAASSDHYLVDLTLPAVVENAPWEKGDLGAWEALLAPDAGNGWGWAIGTDGSRLVVFGLPVAHQKAVDEAILSTLKRRAGRVSTERTGEITEYLVGPGLRVLATRRTGEFLWIATSRQALGAVEAPRPAAGVLRWAKLDTASIRQEAQFWARAEGPASPDRSRPFSDRLLGLLGWMPDTRSIGVERRKTATGWTERVVFGGPLTR